MVAEGAWIATLGAFLAREIVVLHTTKPQVGGRVWLTLTEILVHKNAFITGNTVIVSQAISTILAYFNSIGCARHAH